MNIKDLVKGDKVVSFVKYSDGVLHYSTDCGFVFPVPVSDVGDATFLASDRAMLFMRYLRKQLALTVAVPAAVSGAAPMTTDACAKFSYFKGGDLWFVASDGFEFPVSIAGLAGEISASVPTDSVSTYIAKHREFLTSAFRETIEA